MSAHPEDCKCHLHIETTCTHCNWTGIGTTRLGTHTKKEHPEHFVSKRTNSVRRLAARVVQSRAVAQEIKRLAKRGIRYLPKSRLDASTRKMVQAWLDSTSTSQPLLTSGIENSEQGIRSIREFKALKASILESAKLSGDGLPALYERNTQFQTDVAGEILKLAFTLNRSWSFAVHLLLLYGLESLAEEISTTGPLPPSEVASPSKAIAESEKNQAYEEAKAAKDEAFYARNPGYDPDKPPERYVVRQKYDI